MAVASGNKFLCPHVGCYFSHPDRSIVKAHRKQRHRNATTLMDTTPDPKWAYERE